MLQSAKGSFVWWWRCGFKPTSKTFFDLAHGASGNYSDYLPDAAFAYLSLLNGRRARTVLGDKFLFERVIGAHAPVPQTLAFITRGEVFPQTAEGPIRDTATLLEYAHAHPVFLKPSFGAKGKGVRGLSGGAGGFCLDGRCVGRAEVEALIAQLDDYLVVPWIRGAAYATTVFPEAGNTLRIITMQDPEDGHRPFIAVAIQKFGTRASAPTDNWSRGGLFTHVDVETGTLGCGLGELSKTAGKPVWHRAHPDTEAPIEGLQIPRWQELKEELLTLVAKFPFLRYVGWDVLVTEEGFYLIEGNPAPVVVSLQLERPALHDPRVRRFVAHHRVLENCPGTSLSLRRVVAPGGMLGQVVETSWHAKYESRPKRSWLRVACSGRSSRR